MLVVGGDDEEVCSPPPDPYPCLEGPPQDLLIPLRGAMDRGVLLDPFLGPPGGQLLDGGDELVEAILGSVGGAVEGFWEIVGGVD